MRRYYKQPYQPPAAVRRHGAKKAAAEPLVQPDWDGTIHDLTKMRASPDELLRRKLSRMSHNHMSLALRQNPPAAATAGSSRYSGAQAHDDADDQCCDGSDLDSDQGGELSGSQQQRSRWHNQQHDAARAAGATATAGYACSEGASSSLSEGADADDLCRWDSPLQQQRRRVLPNTTNKQLQDKQGGGARDARWWDQHLPRAQQQGEERALQLQQQQLGGPRVVQVLLDKIEALDAQLQRQQQQQQQAAEQQLQPSAREQQLQQQLSVTQQQLADAQLLLQRQEDDHREFVRHASSLLTLLQTQLQRLLTQQPPSVPHHQLAPLEELQHIIAQQLATARATQAQPHMQQQQQQQHPGGNSSSPARSAGTAQQPPSAGSSLRQRLSAAAVVTSSSSPPKRPAGSIGVAIADTLELPTFAGLQRQAAAAAGGGGGAGGNSDPSASGAIRSLQHSMQQLQFAVQGERQDTGGPGSDTVLGLPLPTHAAAAAAALPSVVFWQSSEVSSPRPQQLDMRGAASSMPHLHLSSAAGVQDVQQQHGALAEHAAGPAAALPRNLLSSSRGDGVLPGLSDVDRGLSEGLSRSAVSRFHSAAGSSPPPPAAIDAAVRRGVQSEGLRGNVSLRDHLASIEGRGADHHAFRLT